MATAPTFQPPFPSQQAAAALLGYRDHVHAVQRETLAAGVPYAIVNERDQLVFVHPDRTHRASEKIEAYTAD